MQDNILLM